jgi:hypothetical protein
VSNVTLKWAQGSLQFDDKSNKSLGALLQFHDERVRPVGVSVIVAELVEAHERSTQCQQFSFSHVPQIGSLTVLWSQWRLFWCSQS